MKSQYAISFPNKHQQYSQKNIRYIGRKPYWKITSWFCHTLNNGINLDQYPIDVLKFIVFWTEDPNKWLPNLEIPNVKLTQFLICPKAKFKKNVNYVQPFDQIKRQTYKWFERIQTAWYYSREVFAIDKEWHRNEFDIMDTISENIVTSIYLWIGLASLK